MSYTKFTLDIRSLDISIISAILTVPKTVYCTEYTCRENIEYNKQQTTIYADESAGSFDSGFVPVTGCARYGIFYWCNVVSPAILSLSQLLCKWNETETSNIGCTQTDSLISGYI